MPKQEARATAARHAISRDKRVVGVRSQSTSGYRPDLESIVLVVKSSKRIENRISDIWSNGYATTLPLF
jgi:hypothetical protein